MTTRWSGVSAGRSSTSGRPMLPPSSTGWAGSAARRAAMSDDVVVLPFVPVTPIVGAGQRRRKRSASDTSAGAVGSPAGRAVDEAAEGRPEARLGRREVGVDRRRRRHERGPVEGGRRVDVRPERGDAPSPPRAPDRAPRGRAELVGRPAVVDGHPAPRRRRRTGRGAIPLRASAEDGDRAHRAAPRPGRPPASARRGRSGGRSSSSSSSPAHGRA